MTRQFDPELIGRLVRRRLREMRATAGLTQQAVATELDWSLTKVIRIEQGNVGLSTTDLRMLLITYGVSDPDEVAAMVEQGKRSRALPWHAEYDEVLDPAFRRRIAFESAATAIFEFDPLFIPGLLQTPDYARAVLDTVFADEEVDLAVHARMERQTRLAADRPEVEVVIDEAAILRAVGGPSVMAAQLKRLITGTAKSGTVLRVVPLARGAHAGLSGPFSLLAMEPALDVETVLFVEYLGRDYLTKDDPDVVSRYEARRAAVTAMALPQAESLELIKRVADEMERRAR